MNYLHKKTPLWVRGAFYMVLRKGGKVRKNVR